MNSLAAELAAFRTSNGFTMRTAADALGVRYDTWRGWELGRRPGAAAGPLARLLRLLAWHPEMLDELQDVGSDPLDDESDPHYAEPVET